MIEYKIIKHFESSIDSVYKYGHFIIFDGNCIKIYYGAVENCKNMIDIEEYKLNIEYRKSRGIDDGYIKNHKEIMEFISIYQRELKFSKLYG